MAAVAFSAELQPKDFAAFNAENADWAKQQIAKYPPGRQQSAIIPLLWRAQEQNGGWLPEPAIRHVGEMLGMPHIRALEVATFCTMFVLEPCGKSSRPGLRHHAVPVARRGGDLRRLQETHLGRAVPCLGRRQFLLGGSRVPGGLRECADGADLERHL